MGLFIDVKAVLFSRAFYSLVTNIFRSGVTFSFVVEFVVRRHALRPWIYFLFLRNQSGINYQIIEIYGL